MKNPHWNAPPTGAYNESVKHVSVKQISPTCICQTNLSNLWVLEIGRRPKKQNSSWWLLPVILSLIILTKNIMRKKNKQNKNDWT